MISLLLRRQVQFDSYCYKYDAPPELSYPLNVGFDVNLMGLQFIRVGVLGLIRSLGLRQEFANQALFLFFLDAREELRSEFRDCFRFVERKFVVDFTALKMTGHATRPKDRLDLSFKIRLCVCGTGE